MEITTMIICCLVCLLANFFVVSAAIRIAINNFYDLFTSIVEVLIKESENGNSFPLNRFTEMVKKSTGNRG